MKVSRLRSPDSGRSPAQAVARTPGKGGDAVRQFRGEPVGAGRIVARQPQLHGGRRHPARLEARIDRQGALEAAQKEACGREQNEAQGDLRCDEDAIETAAPRAGQGTLLEGRDHLGTRRLESGSQAKRDRREQRDGECNQKRPQVEPGREGLEALSPRQGSAEREHERPLGNEQSSGATEQRQEKALRQQLSADPQASGPEREAHGDLGPACQGPSQEQVGQVGAGHEEHEADGAAQQRQQARRGGLAGRARGGSRQGLEGDRRSVEGARGVGGGQPFDERIERGLRARERHSGLEASERREPAPAPPSVVQARQGSRGGLAEGTDWNPEIRWLPESDAAKRGVGHADDGEGNTVQLQNGADRRWRRSERASPEAIRENGDRRAGLLVRRRQQAAALRAHAERFEIVARDDSAAQPPGGARGGQVEGPHAPGAQTFEDFGLLPDVGEGRIREAARAQVRELDGAVNARERPQHHGVEKAESGRLDSDPEREDRERRGRKARGPTKHSEGESQVLNDHDILRTRSAAPETADARRPACRAAHTRKMTPPEHDGHHRGDPCVAGRTP